MKAYLPWNLGDYNTTLYSLLLVFLTSVLISWFIILSKIRFTLKGFIIPAILILNFYVSAKVGHVLTNQAVKAFCHLNEDKFIELKQILEEGNIKTISRIPLNSHFTIRTNEGEYITHKRLVDLAKQLGFLSANRQTNIKIIYQFSMWGGYGLILADEEQNNTVQVEFGGEITKWQEINTNIYYYEFE
ncbi:hypothetical protein [Carboxylicivirga marina]|uniref:hypothetical protein n=1 Tax=Carboxylicivirga marina TaxID=2800988 RepID=UPI0025981DB9|nr:hypothetical protein [uncultured Carboxylicivirga sp.]